MAKKDNDFKKMKLEELTALLNETEENLLRERAKIASSGKKNSQDIKKLKLKIARIKTEISSK